MLPLLIFLTFVLLIFAGLWVARRYGPVPAYLSFAWLIPLTSFTWLRWGESELGFGESILNVPFLLAVLAASFMLGAICFPLLIAKNRGRLSILKVVGLSLGSLLHGSACLLYALIFAAVLIWGK